MPETESRDDRLVTCPECRSTFEAEDGSIVQHPAAPETETDANGWVEALLSGHHWGDDTAAVGRIAMQCGCGWKDSGAASRIYALRERHDKHRAEVIATAARERVRVVEGERDAAREANGWNEWACKQNQNLYAETLARAESAEAQLRVVEGERDAARLATCDLGHGWDDNPARVYGHYGSPRTCIRLKATDEWVYDPAWEDAR